MYDARTTRHLEKFIPVFITHGTVLFSVVAGGLDRLQVCPCRINGVFPHKLFQKRRAFGRNVCRRHVSVYLSSKSFHESLDVVGTIVQDCNVQRRFPVLVLVVDAGEVSFVIVDSTSSSTHGLEIVNVSSGVLPVDRCVSGVKMEQVVTAGFVCSRQDFSGLYEELQHFWFAEYCKKDGRRRVVFSNWDKRSQNTAVSNTQCQLEVVAIDDDAPH